MSLAHSHDQDNDACQLCLQITSSTPVGRKCDIRELTSGIPHLILIRTHNNPCKLSKLNQTKTINPGNPRNACTPSHQTVLSAERLSTKCKSFQRLSGSPSPSLSRRTWPCLPRPNLPHSNLRTINVSIKGRVREACQGW